MSHIERREFLKRAVLAGTATVGASSFATQHPLNAAVTKSPNEKLNIGVIGPNGRGAANAKGVAGENIVALCDVDSQRLTAASKLYPKAKTFVDFRALLDVKELDAVVVSTPDHMHAIPAVTAMRRGLHVYCEKPLAHSVHEVRVMRETAKKHGLVTQMGTQIHAQNNYRRVVELIKAGAIGKVRRVHVWMGGRPDLRMPAGHSTVAKRVKKAAPPKHVNYDLWLGPAPERPFHLSHFHFNWRYWWDFGGGVLGDFGCHFMDLPHWALGLGAPTKVSAGGSKEYVGDNNVPSNLRVDYHYAKTSSAPAVHMTWYHGKWSLDLHGFRAGVLFEGERGMLLADYGRNRVFLGDHDGKAEVLTSEKIAPSIGHHREWTEAVKSRGSTTCNFEYSGNLTETVQLGNAAYRAREALEWDAKALRVTNTRSADSIIRREYRKGWTL
ncbi:MAG: Gfo/Idh/MocA family oxidoreductase [Planctomycetota bacterium]